MDIASSFSGGDASFAERLSIRWSWRTEEERVIMATIRLEVVTPEKMIFSGDYAVARQIEYATADPKAGQQRSSEN